MLNEFSDKDPNNKPKPFILTAEFWVGIAAVSFGFAFILGLIA